MEAAMPCRMGTKKRSSRLREPASETTESNTKTKHACIVEAHASTLYQEILRITSRKKRFNSIRHYNLVHKFVAMPQAMKVPDAKVAVEEEWEKLEKLPAWQLNKVKMAESLVQHWRPSCSFLNEICMVTHFRDYCGKDTFKKFSWDKDGRKYPFGNAFFASNAARSIPICIRGWQKMAGRRQNFNPMWEK